MKSTYGTMYYVDDMKKSVKYFSKLLGRKPRFASPEWTEFAIGPHALCLHEKGRKSKPSPNGVLIVNAKGVRALFEKYKKQKLNVSGLHEVHPGASSFTLRDPSGNEISVYGTP